LIDVKSKRRGKLPYFAQVKVKYRRIILEKDAADRGRKKEAVGGNRKKEQGGGTERRH